jgi:VanZ family protein
MDGRRPAALAAAALAALVLYASLFPFEGWRWPPGSTLTELLVLPWPRYRPPFDLWTNFFGYLPLGLLLALAWRRGGAALLAAAVLSYALEVTQQFLPTRHPSLLDLALNAGGAATGALLAYPVERGGWLARWQRRSALWFDAGSAGAVLLLLIWPLALLFPAPVPLGLGQVGPLLLPPLTAALEGVPWAANWHAALLAEARPPPAPGPALEATVTLLGQLSPCLLAFSIVAPGWRRVALVAGALALSSGLLMVSTALNFGPDHALAWWTPNSALALGAAALLALLLVPVPRRLAAALGLVTLTAGVLLVARLPVDPYFALSLQSWEQGRFIRFHGLAQWVGWLWPYAAGLWLLGRLGAPPKIRG